MDHPPYSPELAPCEFWLFPKLKYALQGQRFADLSDIQRNVKTLLRGIPENDFQGSFLQLHRRLAKCTASQGEYFEETTTASAQVSKFCFHRATPGIKLSHHVLYYLL
jgi:hypothetical protein